MKLKKGENHPLNLTEFIGKDFVFLFLQLTGFPDKNPGIIPIKNLALLRYERLNKKDLLEILLELEGMGALKIEPPEDEGPILDISEKTIEFIGSALDLYIERFIKGKLLSNRGNPYNFKKHKKLFLEKIEKEIADSQAILNFTDADFDDRFCFFECALAMEKQGHIKIIKIINERIPETKAHYMISFEVKNKSLKALGVEKEKRHLKLRCFKKGTIGYFQIKKDSVPREVGATNTRYYKLLKYLCERGVDQKISFQKAFEAIKSGVHYGSKKYEDEEEIALAYAKKFLQKKNKQKVYILKPYKIMIDSESRKIWVE